MDREEFVLDGGHATPQPAPNVIRLDPDDLRAELQNIAHDLRGTAWSTEGLLRLLQDTWTDRGEDERLRIVKLALTQAATLQTLSPRLERLYREPRIGVGRIHAAGDVASRT